MKKKIVNFWHEKQGTILQITLGAIMALFIGIMIAVYLIAKQADPVILDEKGRPLHSQSVPHGY